MERTQCYFKKAPSSWQRCLLSWHVRFVLCWFCKEKCYVKHWKLFNSWEEGLTVEEYHLGISSDILQFLQGHMQSRNAFRPIVCKQRYVMDYDMVYVIFCGDSEYIPFTAKLASTFFALRKTAEQLRHVHYSWRINLHGKFFWQTSTFCLKITELGVFE